MILQVKVITRAKKNAVKKEGEVLKVYLTAPPVQGKANKALIGLLSEYFGVKKSNVRILRGEKSSRKVLEVDKK